MQVGSGNVLRLRLGDFLSDRMKKFVLTIILLLCAANLFLFLWKVHKKRVVEHGFSPLGPISGSVEPQKEPQKELELPEFIQVPKFRESEDSIFGDILSHSQEQPFGGSSRMTNAHETAHGIHSYLRNNHASGRANGFYCLEGRGVIIDEPRIRKHQVIEFLPENLRSYRFDLYISGQTEWDDTPLYLVDEWTAYVLGGMTGVEDVQTGRYRGGWTDGVSGCLDFSIYVMALSMTIQKYDVQYWESNQQYRRFLVWWLKEAEKTFIAGRMMEEFKWDKQDKLLIEFLTSDSAEDMREFSNKYLGGAWVGISSMSIETNYRPFQTKEFGNNR